MTNVRRVYHPTLNSFHDVKASDADKWKKAGWRLTAPDHVDESDAPKVGEGRGVVDIPREIPVLEDTSRTTTPTATTAAPATTTTDTTAS
jgi:hypothetical protein